MIRNLLGAALAVLAAGCVDNADPTIHPAPIPGSTYRIGPSRPEPGSAAVIDIFTTDKDCRKVFRDDGSHNKDEFADNEARIAACTPKVDRASGEVHVAFRLAAADNLKQGLMLPLEKDAIMLAHHNRAVDIFDFQPHEPVQPGQLFVLVIDASGSMKNVDDEDVSRWVRVKNALMANADVFINEKDGHRSAVAPFIFDHRGLVGMGGEDYPKAPVYEKVKAFRDLVKPYPTPYNAGTGMYDAVQKAVGPLLQTQTAVKDFLESADMEPTIIVLTDGFNTNNGSATVTYCRENAQPLAETLGAIKSAVNKGPLGKRPRVYTVGFGSAFRRGVTPPADSTSVSESDLCGEFADNVIPNRLDKDWIDNVSLRWMAQIGAGEAFITGADHKKLGEAFQGTARKRYSWYSVKYRADPNLYHRQAVDVTIRVVKGAEATTNVKLHPSAWLDAPTGTHPDGDKWFTPTPVRAATAFAVPTVGFLLLFGYIGPAMFNARRAMFRRSRKVRTRK